MQLMGSRNLKYLLDDEVIAVRVTKPTVPEAIAKNYEEREVERTKVLIKKQEQKLRQKCNFLLNKNPKFKNQFPRFKPRPIT